MKNVKRHISHAAFLAVLVGLLVIPTVVQAVEIKEIITASPSWETYTNQDGTGLYHEILQKVFTLYGVPVRHIYSKSGRAEQLVLKGEADMMTCKDKPRPSPLVLARYPMYVNDFYVFFKKDRIGEWKNNESLRDKEVLCQPTYYNQKNFCVPVVIKEIQTGAQAVEMIRLDRSDFYVDDMTLIKQSLKEANTPYDREQFDIRKVGRRSYHPLVKPTKKGLKIIKMYNDGLIQLHKAGELKPIYEKWGHQYPDFDKY